MDIQAVQALLEDPISRVPGAHRDLLCLALRQGKAFYGWLRWELAALNAKLRGGIVEVGKRGFDLALKTW